MEVHSSRHISEAVLSDGNCPLDDIPIKQHVRCAVCSILIGSKHHMKRAIQIGKYAYCTDCISRQEKKK